MRIGKPVAGLALATSALTGVGVGALALAPTVASAQEQPSTPDQNQADQNQADQNQDGQQADRPHRPHGPGLAAAAEAIGIEKSALRDALQGGQSIADVAKAHNVSVDTVVDAMVADAREHITAFVNGQKPDDAPDRQQNGQDQGGQNQGEQEQSSPDS